MDELEDKLYWYRARLVRIIDGDTVVVDIDHGMNLWQKDMHIRLFGIDAPETSGDTRASGEAATRRLTELLPAPGTNILLHTRKDKRGSFARMMADIYVSGRNINEIMVNEGYAVEFRVEKKAAKPHT